MCIHTFDFACLFVYLVCILFLYFTVDDTRIILKDVDPKVPSSDYINANLIQVR